MAANTVIYDHLIVPVPQHSSLACRDQICWKLWSRFQDEPSRAISATHSATICKHHMNWSSYKLWSMYSWLGMLSWCAPVSFYFTDGKYPLQHERQFWRMGRAVFTVDAVRRIGTEIVRLIRVEILNVYYSYHARSTTARKRHNPRGLCCSCVRDILPPHCKCSPLFNLSLFLTISRIRNSAANVLPLYIWLQTHQTDTFHRAAWDGLW